MILLLYLPLAASLTDMESDSIKIMLEAPALSARRGGAMLIPSARAPTATEPSAGACSSPRLSLGVPLPALTRACSTMAARAQLHHAASPAPLLHLHLHRTHHTHVTACYTRSPLQLQRPAPAETRSSCLRAAIARQALICTSDLIGGNPRPSLEISIALFQPSTSTSTATSLYDCSDCSAACSD